MWHNRVTTLLGDLYSFGAWSCNKNDTIEQQGLKEGLLELVMATLNFYNNDFQPKLKLTSTSKIFIK
jgi:hypothetical protein